MSMSTSGPGVATAAWWVRAALTWQAGRDSGIGPGSRFPVSPSGAEVVWRLRLMRKGHDEGAWSGCRSQPESLLAETCRNLQKHCHTTYLFVGSIGDLEPKPHVGRAGNTHISRSECPWRILNRHFCNINRTQKCNTEPQPQTIYQL